MEAAWYNLRLECLPIINFYIHLNKQTNEQTNKWTNNWTNKRTNKWTNTNKQMNKQTNMNLLFFFLYSYCHHVVRNCDVYLHTNTIHSIWRRLYNNPVLLARKVSSAHAAPQTNCSHFANVSGLLLLFCLQMLPLECLRSAHFVYISFYLLSSCLLRCTSLTLPT